MTNIINMDDFRKILLTDPITQTEMTSDEFLKLNTEREEASPGVKLFNEALKEVHDNTYHGLEDIEAQETMKQYILFLEDSYRKNNK